MNPRLGWALALVALVVGYATGGWRGVGLAGSALAFWLMLQFNRSVRVMKIAAQSPVGTVPSAVMLHARLRPGMPMLEVVAATRSLGRQPGDGGDTWAWTDTAGNRLEVGFANGRCTHWTLLRPEDPSPAHGQVGESLSSSPPMPTSRP